MFRPNALNREVSAQITQLFVQTLAKCCAKLSAITLSSAIPSTQVTRLPEDPNVNVA